MMRAVECTAYGPPEVLKLTKVKKPIPKKNEILIKIHATAATASDCIVRGFKLPRRSPRGVLMGMVLGFSRPRNPILGMILSGEVESKGNSVTRFGIGDRVFGWTLKDGVTIRFGTYAEYKCMPEESVVTLTPTGLSYQEAAAIPYGGLIALHYLRKGGIQDASNVLIYGASGAIGSSALQLAGYFGARVTGVCSTGNLDMVRSLGADSVVDYTSDDPDTIEGSFDLILDAVGRWKDSDFKQRCKKLLAPGGTYISVDDGSPKANLEGLELLKKITAEGKLKPVIDTVYPLEKTVDAHRHVDGGHKKGNVIIAVS
jgi:NADPH:quinone reductase-like Zn-dependent oxidoreductase